MILRTLFITLLIVLMTGALHAATTPDGDAAPAQGIARELARHRAAHYRDVRYRLRVEVARGAERLKGTVEIRVVLDGAAGDLVLDWRTATHDGKPTARVSDIEANGRAVSDARIVNDHIVIPRAHLATGENVVRMSFESPISATGSAAVTRYRDRTDDAEYIYTLFVPSDASTAFPCFDQPDLKARFTLDLTAPADWKVVANTAVEQSEAGAGDKTRRTVFRETQPISTYIFAFAAGDFAEFQDAASTLPSRLFVRRSKAARARDELAEVFRLNREGVKYFERYFARPFPFPKYDLVIIPEFPFRGMEHAGATFLREESILFPSDPTANDLLSRADVILHEAAHQWFGDLVTMRWFDDLWLKEGFATFMAAKGVEALLPEYNAWKIFYQRNKPLAYETDITKGTTPIWQELPNLSAAKSAYGNIVYRKAPAVLRQAEFYLGADEFQKAVQSFLKEHAFANATWDDLVRAFERTSGQRLATWAEAWVKRRGMPKVSVSRANANGHARAAAPIIIIRQDNALGEGGAWPMRLKVLLVGHNSRGAAHTKTETVTLDGTGRPQAIPARGFRNVAYVFANYEDYGYGLFLLDDVSRAHVRRTLGEVRDDFLRAMLWGALWDSVREAELDPADYVALALAHVARERDETTVQSILSRTTTAFHRYLSDTERQRVAVQLEQLIFSQMFNAETAGLRITYFRAFQALATSEQARSELKQILSGEIKVPGMTLRPRDRFDIISALLARSDPDAPTLLERERAADTSDDARRYAFAAGASVASEAVKRKYFDAFINDPKLAESWIEASIAPFNTPRQSGLTLPYLDDALRQLPTLKRTRKIFFVNGWLAAFIGGQCNPDARDIVDGFLRREPTLDRDLRLKVLEAADGLERCVRIKTKYSPPSKVVGQRR